MAKNLTPKRRTKHAHLLPYPDFPLSPHVPTGRWYKVIRGQRVYFGPLADPDAALEKYQRERDDLYAGRTPRPTADGFTIRDLCNHFLTAKTRAVEAGELQRRTLADYRTATDDIIAAFGRTRLVADLGPDDFGPFRAQLAKRLSAVPLGNHIQRVRTVFKYAYDNGLIDAPVRFGSSFAKPPRRIIRIERAKARQEHGGKMFGAADIQKMLKADTSAQLKAMVLLGVNCGFGNTDLGTLPLSAVNLDDGWIDYARPKSGIARRCPLWAETRAALRDALANRPTPKDKAADGLVFITKYGKPWVRDTDEGKHIDGIAQEFAKLLTDLDLKRQRVGFYALRHTFLTIAEESMDKPAVDFIMGHVDDSMADRYRERIGDDRLKRVVQHVRDWLYAKPKRTKKRTTKAKVKQASKAPGDKPRLKLVG